MTQPIVVAALYKFVTLQDYVELREPLLKAMLDNGVKGTLLLANEGALATLQDGDVSRVYIVGEPYYPLLDGAHGVISCNVLADVVVCQTEAVAILSGTATGTAALFRDMTFDGRHAYIV